MKQGASDLCTDTCIISTCLCLHSCILSIFVFFCLVLCVGQLIIFQLLIQLT